MDRRRFDYGVGALVSLAAHGLVAWLGVDWGRAEQVAPRAEAAPLFEVVALDATAVRAILEPEPALVLPALVEAPTAAEPSPAPAWPEASPRAPIPERPTAALVDVPHPEPGLPLAGPTERLTVFQPIAVTPAGEELVAADDSPPAEPAPTGADTEPEDEAAPASPSTLPSLQDVTELLSHRARIPYPERARRLGIQGVAVVGIDIRDDGTVGRTWLIRSSGSSILDRAAVAGVRRWRFDMDAVREAGVGRRFRQDIRFQFR